MTTTSLRPAIFLDKDGTLLENVPFNVEPSKMRYAPRAQTALRRLGRLDVPLIVITNQSGIAFGRFPRTALDAVEQELAKMFAHCGARLHGFYACPHHPQGTVPAYACDCLCRKPMPGLLRRAATEHGIDMNRSWFVGDILDDVEAGHRAGCRTILIDNGNETEWAIDEHNAHLRRPDHLAPDLAVAARIIGGLLTGPGRDPRNGPGDRSADAFGTVNRR
jgi:D-glycero-D-manno-heptose 1,7-bisphosphate phosphatase